MKPWMMAGSTALALLYATGAVQAAVTPEDVWANWKAMAGDYGQTITAASEGREGDTLVVKGLTMALDQNGAKASGKIDEMRFKDQGDGTVQITMSDSYSMTLDTPAVDTQGAAKMAFTLSLPGMTTVASGSADAMSYALDAPDIKVHLEGADVADPTKSAINADVALSGTTGTYAVTKADPGQKVDYKFASKSADITATVKDSAQGTDVSLKLGVADIAGTSSGMFLGAAQMADIAAALKAGFGVQTSVTYGAGTYEMNVKQGDQPTKVSGAIGSGGFDMALDHGKFQMTTASKNVTMAVESAMIPLPDLSASYGEATFGLLVPLEKSDAPADFSLLTKLIDLKISDSIWSMIDAGGALPHDPATLVIDTKGTATLTADLTDQGAMDALGGTAPGLLNSFDVNSIDVKIAGAELTGNGGFTFDNADMSGMGGMPAPTGKLDLKAVGLTGLIDKLVTMGLIPEDQAMQGKMMMGMFAKPGEGPDTLTSSIEFKDKKMMINGMEMPMQ